MGADNVLICALAKKYGIPKMTLCKCVTGWVVGWGHVSGGKGKGHVLTMGEYLVSV